MARKARALAGSGIYHVVNRGIGQQILFEDDQDYRRFLKYVKKFSDEEGFEVHAYCLMENHVHLLLHGEARLDRLMKRVGVTYAHYYNEKYSRTGHLFQDRFRSEPVEDPRGLLCVARYIHNNPQAAGICAREKYRWSSWKEYTIRPVVINPQPVLDAAGGVGGFLSFSASEDEKGYLDISERRRLTDQAALGVIREKLRLDSGTKLQEMNRARRDSALQTLKSSGLSIRQISRLTGISRGVVQDV